MRSHANLLKLGLDRDPIFATKLIQSYSAAGDSSSLAAARRLFDAVPSTARDPHLWSAIISLFSRSHLPLHALRLFSRIPRPTPYAAASAARAAAAAAATVDPFFAAVLHAKFIALGLIRLNLIVATSVVDMYGKIGELHSARKVFDEMPDRNVVSWNSMVSGYVNVGMGSCALELFYRMMCFENSVHVDRHTLSSVLTACAVIPDLSLGMQVHCFLHKAGHDWDPAVTNALANMYFRCSDVQSAEQAVEGSDDSLVSMLMIIKGYAFNERYNDVTRRIHDTGVFMELFTVDPSVAIPVLTASANLGLLNIGRQVHGLIITTGICKNYQFSDPQFVIVIENALINMYCKCSSIGDAQSVFHHVPERHISHCNALISGCIHNCLLDEAEVLFDEMPVRSVISWTAMISGYVQIGMPNEGLRILARLYSEGGSLEGNCFSFSTALNACSCLAALETGKQIHAHALRTAALHGFNQVPVESALVDMYSKSGNLCYARRVFNRMGRRNVVSWTSMVTGYVSHGLGHEAIELLEQMISMGFTPNEVTFVAILTGCSRCGLVDKGLHFFNLMRNSYGIAPRGHHYGCMIDMLARAGKLAEAWALVGEIKEKDTAAACGALLGGCELHGDVDIGSKVASRMLERKELSSDTYIAISNVYAAAGMWDEVHRIREESRNREDCVAKEPGYSQIHCSSHR